MRRIVTKKRILILCEGVTEEVYGKALRSKYVPRDLQRVVTIEINRHKKNDPLNLVAEAKKRVSQAKRERMPFSHVWLFFDHDNSPHLSHVMNEINRNEFHLAFTAISIEFWFIIHYEDCGKAFINGEECSKYLKKLWPSYHKTKINHFIELEPYVENALDRAKVLEEKNKDFDILSAQPYTSVHKLIDFFKALGTSA